MQRQEYQINWDLKPFMFGYISTPPRFRYPLYIYFRSRTNIHKDLFVDIVVISIIYQLIILILKLLFVCQYVFC